MVKPIGVLKAITGLGLIWVISLVVWSMTFATIIRPYELNRSIEQGCSQFRAYNTGRNLTTDEKHLLQSTFTRLAQLDPRYLDLSTATVWWSYLIDNRNLKDSFQIKLDESYSLLTGFCAVKVKFNPGLTPSDLIPVPSKSP